MQVKLADNIRELRKSRNMTQEELAERLNVSTGAVSKWERGASEPELQILMEIAGIFRVSTDALIGYSIGNETPREMAGQITQRYKEMRIEEAMALADEALAKYPNDLYVVTAAAGLFQITKTVGYGDNLEKAIGLINRAITLLSQDTRGDFSEVELRNDIAFCLLQQEKYDEAIEELKANNVCNINDDLIGMTLINEKKDYKAGMEHVATSSIYVLLRFVRICMASLNAYAGLHKPEMAVKTCDMLEQVVRAIAIDPEQTTVMDKYVSLVEAGAAYQIMNIGDTDRTQRYLQKAYDWAAKYDRRPIMTMDNLMICSEDKDGSIAFDDVGATAFISVDKYLSGEKDNGTYGLWKEIIRENENKSID